MATTNMSAMSARRAHTVESLSALDENTTCDGSSATIIPADSATAGRATSRASFAVAAAATAPKTAASSRPQTKDEPNAHMAAAIGNEYDAVVSAIRRVSGSHAPVPWRTMARAINQYVSSSGK